MNDKKIKSLLIKNSFKTDEYGRVIINNPELMDLCSGARLEPIFPDSNGACHDNGACGNAGCANASC